ncbi:hypothetical protein CC78DRAFT_586146 [Lojkania enalia]|uniref:Uncharacterized protein n=1 Tax=Lojkania enalia TaxID=147567 RepID=A0A9P4K1X0_9PLEO|nr:hypothetical protein CC78DRAFT_586146 [Didymosphaeria enalia]
MAHDSTRTWRTSFSAPPMRTRGRQKHHCLNSDRKAYFYFHRARPMALSLEQKDELLVLVIDNPPLTWSGMYPYWAWRDEYHCLRDCPPRCCEARASTIRFWARILECDAENEGSEHRYGRALQPCCEQTRYPVPVDLGKRGKVSDTNWDIESLEDAERI